MRANEFIVESTVSGAEPFQGLHMKIRDDDYEVICSAHDASGREMGSVVMMKGDDNELDPQDLIVIDRFRGQGVAKVMYDYIKSKGYTIIKSHDVTRIADQGTQSGEHFWQKNRGEETVWEDNTVAEGENYKFHMFAYLQDGTIKEFNVIANGDRNAKILARKKLIEKGYTKIYSIDIQGMSPVHGPVNYKIR